MINYVVKPGDTLSVIAVKYRTTIQILMEDNPFIGTDQKLSLGWKLTIYTPEENAKRNIRFMYEQMDRINTLKASLETSEHMLSKPRNPVYYKGRVVLEGQEAFARTLAETPLIEVQANGFKKTIRTLPVGTILRVYERGYMDGLIYYLVDEYRWVSSDPSVVHYDPIPAYELDGRIQIDNPKKSYLQTFAASGPKKTTSNLTIAPKSMIGSGPAPSYSKANDGLSSMPLFEAPDYKRPILQMKNAKGDSKTIELRALGFNANYSNSIQPAATNGGWMINIRAHNLPVLNINGLLMETKANDEFNDFMTRYHTYLKAAKTDDYYALGVSTLFYKQTEYKGIVVSFSFTDRSEESLHRKYNMQMLVLKEKSLSLSERKNIDTVVSRKGFSTEDAFRSNIGAMLANPITGKYFTDFY